MFDAIFPKHWTTLQRLMWLKTNALARAVYEIVTGNPVTFTAKSAPLRQLKVAFSPVQAGSGDPSPDNVRPISGWSEVTVYHSGADTSDPRSISISLGDTYYSGTLDVVTGVLTATWASVDLGSLTWTYNAQYAFFQSSAITGIITEQERDIPPYVLCSIYNPVGNGGLASLGDLPDMSVTMRNTFSGCTTKDSRYTDPTAYKTAMSGVQFVYKLATPIPIQLTPQEVQSLLGENVMWSDANGDLTVEYRSN